MHQTTSVSRQQAALLEVGQQGGRRLVEDRAVDVVLFLEEAVAVPVADAFAHRVGAVEELHEADARSSSRRARMQLRAKPALSLFSASSAPYSGERRARSVERSVIRGTLSCMRAAIS